MLSDAKIPDRTTEPSRVQAWLRFVVGSLVLALLIGFFMSGYTPPGVCGAVLRHNQAEDIDASPLFYSEVEHMSELERGVRKLRTQRSLAPRQ